MVRTLLRRLAELPWLIAALLASTLPLSSLAQESFSSLLDELVNRDQLASFPAEAPYTLHQESSFNPAASPIGAPANFTNRDWSKFKGIDTSNGREEKILLDVTGPGAITRAWAVQNPGNNGFIRIYLDGQTTPTLEGPLFGIFGNNALFNATSGDNDLSFENPTYPAGTEYRGANLYAPITFSDGARVTYEGRATGPSDHRYRIFYSFNYRKYALGTRVNSFVTGDPAANQSQLDRVQAALKSPSPTGHIGQIGAIQQTLAAGQSAERSFTGEGAIRELTLKVSAANAVEALQDTYLELTFDGQRTASTPVGQFFGNGRSRGGGNSAYNPVEDLYRTVAANGEMKARWVMPYATTAVVRLVNKGDQDVDVDLGVGVGDWDWDDQSMHFHANYREEFDIEVRNGNNMQPTGPQSVYAATADWNYLTTRGQGVFVGDTLSVHNTGDWFGEGDEKIYVDGEAFPSHFGTGTEDYYGYAYGQHGAVFDFPFISVSSRDGSKTAGVTVNGRVRALDAIPFSKSLKFDMEIWHNSAREVDYAAVTYWYGKPGAVALEVAADLGVDYRGNHDFYQGGLADTAGDGRWTYFASAEQNPSDASADLAALSFGKVGREGGTGYGGGQNVGHSENLVAVSDSILFADGDENIDLEGGLGYHELAVHPGPTGQANQDYFVARWKAGPSSEGLININGSVRNLVSGGGDSIDFSIYVDGVLKFHAAATSDTLEETYFDLDASINAGEHVDFVIGNNGSHQADESWLRATILSPDADLRQLPQAQSNLRGRSNSRVHSSNLGTSRVR